MGCPTCATRVHNSLTALYGVTNATVSHVTGQAQVMFNPDLVDHPTLITAVAAAGNDGKHVYRATLAGG
jgi:copper chaperone CopZ